MAGWLKRIRRDQVITAEEQDKMLLAYMDVQESQVEWERAHLTFQEALGQDQIDYAIYMLEAAERKYQMKLKQAKQLNLNRTQLPDISLKQNG